MTNLFKNSDVISGVVILVFCGVGLLLLKGVHGGPSVFPIVTLVCMSALALMLIGKALRGSTRRRQCMGEFGQESSTEIAASVHIEGEEKTSSSEIRMQPRASNLVLIAGLLTITVMYIMGMSILGFVISTPIYLFAMLLFLGMRRYGVMILTSTLTTVVIFVIFRTVMYISLPAGIFDPTEFLYKLLRY